MRLVNRESWSPRFLNDLVTPHATVSPNDRWTPCGFQAPSEACLGDAADFLPAEQRAILTNWWLAKPGRANTPNWDIVSTCTVDGKPGLVLIEAKAHAGELHEIGLAATDPSNRARIAAAIAEANAALGGPASGWNLSADSHYQLGNRFAWAWKVAGFGIPVVLVYLGFLKAREMGVRAFEGPESWRDCVRAHAQGRVPEYVWDQPIVTGGARMVATITSATVAEVVRSKRRSPPK